MITIIAAIGNNNELGKGNDLIWYLPADLKRFKKITDGHFVIMGRKTFESLGGKPLNGRVNIIITRQKDWSHEGVVVVHSLADALFFAKESDYKEVFIAGGGEIYACKLAVDMFKLKKEDLSDEVSDIITIGEFYEMCDGDRTQIIFT